MSLRPALAALAAALLLAPAARAADAPETRLGRDALPTFELVRLRLDPSQHDCSGSVDVDLSVVKSTSSFTLHSDGQDLKRVYVVQGADTLAATTEPDVDGLLTVTTAKPLALGKAHLHMDFTGAYGTRAVSLYRVVREDRGYLFTQFESTDARKAFPCWDEPCFKFPWQIVLEVPAKQEAISNTPIESETPKGDWKVVTFKRSAPLPSYLIALAVGPFEYTPITGLKFPARVVTVQGQKKLAAVAASDTPKLINALERWFGTPYPYEKLDLIAVPDFAYGAMENAGAITYRDDALLMDPATATVTQRRMLAVFNCHELSHQWFGDLVTMAWWDDLWLNESFADWMASKITDEVFPELQQGLSDLQRIQDVKAGDALPSTMAIRARTTSSAAGLQNVGLVYSKGNAMLSMFESWLGPEVFRKGVRQYLEANKWGNATASDLWKALDAASGTDVSASMATFTDQPGVPYVRCVPIAGGVRLTQERCTPLGTTQAPLTWRIPVALKYPGPKGVVTQRVLLDKASMDVKLPGSPAWVMPNGGGRGYYAWSVPGPMMSRLAKEGAATMTPSERVAFIGNLDMLMTAGEVHGDTYLDALGHFGADASPQVVTSVMRQLAGVRLALVPDSLAAPFAVYVRNTLGPSLARIGNERRPGEDEAIGTMRGELLGWLARRGEDQRAMAFARDAAHRFMADSSSVDPGIVNTVLNLAARKGDEALFDEFRRRFEASKVPAARRQYLAALGAFEDSTLERRACEYSISEHVLPSETFAVWQGGFDKGEADGERFFRWVLTNYDKVSAKVPPPALRFMPLLAGGCSKARLEVAKTFWSDPSRAAPGVEKSLERVSDNVHECITLREREGAAVGDYLRGRAAQ
jgi:alanyl aminopeptidase